MLMRIENETGDNPRKVFPSVQSATEYLEDNVPCHQSGSILILVTEAEIAHYKAVDNGHHAKGWHDLNDDKENKETMMEEDRDRIK